MLLVPKAQGLVEMLQTIYETESCFSADGMSGREPSLEILPRTPLHSIPVAGKYLHLLPTLCPLPSGSLASVPEHGAGSPRLLTWGPLLTSWWRGLLELLGSGGNMLRPPPQGSPASLTSFLLLSGWVFQLYTKASLWPSTGGGGCQLQGPEDCWKILA